ncbi:MAG TPA: hypothetical protein VGK67_01315 [Myxococcales bacterium]|jgi:hypothetical protein
MRLLSLLTLLVAAPALAGDWAASFPPPALASHLDLDQGAYLVAAVGPESREAAQAVQAALQSSGKARLVMDDSALGDLTGLSDAQLVEKCRGLPLDRILVVRVFSPEGGPSNAVASLYDLGGVRQAGFAAEAGMPLQPKTPEVAPPPAQVAAPLPPPAAAPGEKTARERFDEKYIGFADIQIFDSTSGKVTSKWIEPFQGKFRQPLEGIRFYEVVGRTDLVEAYHRRSHVRLGVGLGGLGLVLGGSGLIAWGFLGSCSKVAVASNQCLARDMRPVVAGGVLAGVGVAAALASALINPHPLDGPAAREVADTYNKNLRKELGVPEARREVAPLPSSLAAAELGFEF